MTIHLYWSDFYEQMEELGIQGQYSKIEEMLVHSFKVMFGVDEVTIEWMD